MSIDFSEIEKFPGFRSDALYFIRLSGAYIQSIFWDVFSGDSKSATKRRAAMKALAAEKIEENDRNKELRQAILDPKTRWHQTLDCFSSGFQKFLESFPDEMRLAFEEKLRLEHAIFLRFPDFIKLLVALLQARHHLEHYEERIKKNKAKNFTDEDVARALCLLLPPHFMTLFLGRITVWQGKLISSEARARVEETKSCIRVLAVQITKERRESTRNLFSSERDRQKLKNKSQRKALVSRDRKWFRFFLETSNARKDDYREFNFKIRYYFIGEQNINRIRKALEKNTKEPLNFKRDIEGFYDLTARVNLVLHRYLEILPRDREDKIVGATAEETQDLRSIRNTVAHNGLFWDARRKADASVYDVADVFRIVMAAIRREFGPERLNDCYTALERLFRREQYAVVDLRGDPMSQPRKIRRWTFENREKYSAERYERDMRRAFRKETGRWMKALVLARQSILDRRRTDVPLETGVEK